MRTRKRLVAGPDRNGVKASEIVGNSERDIDSPICTYGQLHDLVVLRSKPSTRYPIAGLVSQTSDTSVFAGRPLPFSDARVSTGPCVGLMLRLPPPPVVAGAGTGCFLYGSANAGDDTFPGVMRNTNPVSASTSWALALIQIALPHVPREELDLMLPDGACSAEPRN